MVVCPECRKLYPSDASECPDDGQFLVPEELLVGAKDDALEPGTMVGEYRIEQKLGAGSFGAVYAGVQPLIGKRVAVKVLHKKFASETGVVSRFVAEARVVNRIKHRNIIDVFSFGVLGDAQPYFVMDLLDGMTLGELLRREGRLGVDEVLSILHGIADGLDAAHEAGVAHRDLKPDNIFLATEKAGGFFPKLLDFGVAKLVSDDLAQKTATGAAIGTPSYMAPEQCRGKKVDHRVDIYALGVVIHEMLTGRRLFHADSAMDVLFMHVSEPPQPMSRVCPDLPEELDAPVLAMLAKNPRDRPISAGAAVAALARRAHALGPARTMETAAPAESSFERALAQREATVTSDGLRFAAAKTPSRETPGVGGSIETLALMGERRPRPLPVGEAPEPSSPAPGSALASTGDDATRPDDAAAKPVAMAPAMTSDGRFALSTKGNAIKVWDMRTGQAIHTFPGQAGPVQTSLPAAPAAPEVRAPQPSPAPVKPGKRAPSWTLLAAVVVVAGAAILAAVASLQTGRAPAPVPVTAETALPTPAPVPSSPVAAPVRHDATGRPR